MWVLILIVVLVVLALMFGGFQKGSQVKGLGPVAGVACVSRVTQPDVPSGKDCGGSGLRGGSGGL